MTMKRAELEKRQAMKLTNALRRSGNPFARAGESELDRRQQRERERALGLVAFAVKLPLDLVKQVQAEADSRGVGLNELVAESLRKGLTA